MSRERWWAIRWHVVRVVVGNPVWLWSAMFDGLREFRRAFGDTWSDRWRARDRKEAWGRFGPLNDGGEDSDA